jgi:DNA-binding transcriptional LysR family regulator
MALSITGWNLKLLQAFVLVAEHRSFRKAADASLRSQSAVSAQIKELESQIGVRLFDRTTRRVSLTAEGMELLEYTRRAFSEIATGLDNIRKSTVSKQDRVSISCMPTITAGLLPLILSRFEERHAGVEVIVRELNNEDVVSSVRNRDVDFGIGVTVPASDCRFTPLLDDEMCALVPQGWVPGVEDDVQASRIIDFPLFLLPQATPTLIALENVARRCGKSLQLGNRFTQPQTMISMTAARRGIAVLPRIFLSGMTFTEIRLLSIREPVISRELSIITSRGSEWSPLAEALAETTAEILSREQSGKKHVFPSTPVA